MQNTEAMDLYLEATVPLGLAAREKNTYMLDTAPLKIWLQILEADPDVADGIKKLLVQSAVPPHIHSMLHGE